jgi:hypothetical protein
MRWLLSNQPLVSRDWCLIIWLLSNQPLVSRNWCLIIWLISNQPLVSRDWCLMVWLTSNQALVRILYIVVKYEKQKTYILLTKPSEQSEKIQKKGKIEISITYSVHRLLSGGFTVTEISPLWSVILPVSETWLSQQTLVPQW